jgi:hypothetical protein
MAQETNRKVVLCYLGRSGNTKYHLHRICNVQPSYIVIIFQHFASSVALIFRRLHELLESIIMQSHVLYLERTIAVFTVLQSTKV